MRFLVLPMLLIVGLSGCVDEGEPLTQDSVQVLIQEELKAKEEAQYQEIDLDGAIEFRVGEGEWSSDPLYISTRQNASHDGSTLPLELEAETPGPIQIRYTGDISAYEGEWFIWGGYYSYSFPIENDPVLRLDAPGAMDVQLYVRGENESYGHKASSIVWEASWVVDGVLNGDAVGAPDAHEILLPSGSQGNLHIRVVATDEPEVSGRKTVLALMEEQWYNACSTPDEGLMVESTDHILESELWGGASSRIAYGHSIPECWNESTIPETQDVAYQMEIELEPHYYGGIYRH